MQNKALIDSVDVPNLRQIATTSGVLCQLSDCPDVALLLLTEGQEAIVDAEDYERLMAYDWTAKRGKSGWYAIATIDGKSTLLSRFLLGATGDAYVDHHNGNTLDHRKINLRPATHTQNCWNSTKRKHRSKRVATSVFKGVAWDASSGKWRVQLRAGKGVRIHVGCFADENEAARAYDKAALHHHGRFARLNFSAEVQA